jgi:catechol 2,3-dioxygenase-like lactoylglutathione lyase family enzyme
MSEEQQSPPPDPATTTRPPFQVRRLDHVVIRARDAEALIRFYADVLGCGVERTVDAVGLTQLRAGDSLIDVVSASGDLGRSGGAAPQRGQGHNVDHFCLQVEPFDADALATHLARHGIEFSRVRTLYGAEGMGPAIYVEDPEGNRVELKGPARQPTRSDRTTDHARSGDPA